MTQQEGQNANVKFNIRKQQKQWHAAFSSVHKSGKACCTQNPLGSACSGVAAAAFKQPFMGSVPCGGIFLHSQCQSCANQNFRSEPSLTCLPITPPRRRLPLGLTETFSCHHLCGRLPQCHYSLATAKCGISDGILSQESENKNKAAPCVLFLSFLLFY